MKINWTAFALLDVDEAVTYIHEFNPDAAFKMSQKIWDSTKLLMSHPNVGRIGRVNETREFVISGTLFLIVYRITHDQIEILRVLHSARKWPEQ